MAIFIGDCLDGFDIGYSFLFLTVSSGIHKAI